MSLLLLLVFRCFLRSRKATSLKTTGAISLHRYQDRGWKGPGRSELAPASYFQCKSRSSSWS